MLALVVGLVAAAPASAAVEVPFVPRFATSVRGDLAIAANTLETCPDAGGTETTCIGGRNGEGTLAALNNNNYEMERVDVDGDPTTIDSSSSTLSLPPGAQVLFAGLFYGARTSKGTGATAAPAPNPAARGTVRLRAPGALGYATLAAAVNDSSSIAGSYTGYADVTPIVAAAGSGTYTVAEVQAGTGLDRYAGWSLVVAYSDPASAPHSIRVYEGLASIVAGEAAFQIGVEGLETPASGTVAANVGIVAYEGDRGSSGDRLSLSGKAIADAANPVNNVFNSSISVRGADLGGRTPNYLDQLGFDADLLGADGLLANGATSATLQESTSLEQYLTQVVALSVELDPAVLEPPAAPAPAPEPQPSGTAAPPPAHKGKEDKGKGGDKGDEKKEGGKGAEPAPRLEVAAPTAPVHPTAVVELAATVTAPAAEPLHAAEVCSRLPDGLTRLRAPGAELDGDTACWHLGKVAAGHSRRVATTARVTASGRRTLVATTTVRAAGAKTRQVRTRLRVRPLALTPCGSRLLRARC
jgi:hypothetical protein